MVFTEYAATLEWIAGVLRQQGYKVHPHACGEDPAARDAGTSMSGAPPRVWGRHFVNCRFTRDSTDSGST